MWLTIFKLLVQVYMSLFSCIIGVLWILTSKAAYFQTDLCLVEKTKKRNGLENRNIWFLLFFSLTKLSRTRILACCWFLFAESQKLFAICESCIVSTGRKWLVLGARGSIMEHRWTYRSNFFRERSNQQNEQSRPNEGQKHSKSKTSNNSLG